MFDEVRSTLLDEAKASPNLLSDLAGLENYIGESYNNRSFIELLQNADDAGSTKFKILKWKNYLFVANNGRMFSGEDLESLCRSASSKKERGESIGYRGIGFKSVVGFANEVHILSGDLEFTFSKKRTFAVIPEATQVPLIRIPHKISEEVKKSIDEISTKLKSEDYKTFFVFSEVTAHEIELEFDSFDTSSLLFLRNIQETDLSIQEAIKTKIGKTSINNNTSNVTISTINKTSSWLVVNNKDVSIAFYQDVGEIKKLDETKSLVYAFLPTEDASGLGVLINGDFSTDPSRKHLIYDEKTLSTLKVCSSHIVDILKENIQDGKNTNIGFVNALIPFMDPRMLQFKKPSFEKYLIEELKSIGDELFGSTLICPQWLNIKDYNQLTKEVDSWRINPQCYGLSGFVSFAKYVGVKEDSLSSFLENINETEITTLGCVQISVQVFKDSFSTRNIELTSASKLKILMVDGKRVSLEEIQNSDLEVDKSFISLLIENGLTEYDVKQFLSKFLSKKKSNSLFVEDFGGKDLLEKKVLSKEENWFDQTRTKSFPATKSSVKRWRSAEENTLEVLNINGFKLTDVSKQNIGYDLEGSDPDGREIQIEVKSITAIGQKFKLTNNEIAVAQEKKESYYIAIVRQLENNIEIALVSNPVEKLVLNRQCVQWIWECSNYDYSPTTFEIE